LFAVFQSGAPARCSLSTSYNAITDAANLERSLDIHHVTPTAADEAELSLRSGTAAAWRRETGSRWARRPQLGELAPGRYHHELNMQYNLESSSENLETKRPGKMF
jgi:hypothetical protein